MRSIAVIAALLIGLVAHAAAESEPPRLDVEAERSASTSGVETLKHDIDGIKTTLQNIEKELELIRLLLSQRLAQPRRAPDSPVIVRFAGSPMLGSPDAPVTVVEFSDYQCPACRSFAETTLPAVKVAYIDSGKGPVCDP